MNNSSYDRKKTRRAMLIAPLVAMLGILPYLFVLNLTFIQSLLAVLAALIVCYLTGLLIGGPGYLVLRSLGFSSTAYLLAYAGLVVITAAFLLDDVYVLISLGPPILLAAGAFCFLRGPVIAGNDARTR